MAQTHSHRVISLGLDQRPVPAGAHVCHIYDNDASHEDILARFVQSGLEAGEWVSCFVDSMPPEALRDHLLQRGVNLPETSHCEFLEARDVYCPDGRFDFRRTMSMLEAEHERHCQNCNGLRVTGEMSWALQGIPGSEHLLEYETRVSALLARLQITAICQYDSRRFDGDTLYRLLQVHPMMIVRDQVILNPYYHP